MQKGFEVNPSEDPNGSIRNVSSNIQFETSFSAHDQATAEENEIFQPLLGTESKDCDDCEATETLNEIYYKTVLGSDDRNFQEDVQRPEPMPASSNTFEDSSNPNQSSYLNPETVSKVTVSSVNTAGYAMFSETGNIFDSSDVSNEDGGIGLGPVLCLECPATFTSDIHLEKHSIVHTKHEEFPVFTFPSGSDINSLIHDVGGQSSLSECNENSAENSSSVFCSNLELLNYVETIKEVGKYLEKRTFECNVCQKTFAHKGNLTRHEFIHTGEKPFECDVCHQTFREKGSLIRHKRIHTGVKAFECDVCHQKFREKSSLIQHKRIHTGERPFECHACHKRFTQKGCLTRHERIHTGEKPFECDVCHKKFTQKGSLKVHKRTHTGKKPFECNLCD